MVLENVVRLLVLLGCFELLLGYGCVNLMVFKEIGDATVDIVMRTVLWRFALRHVIIGVDCDRAFVTFGFAEGRATISINLVKIGCLSHYEVRKGPILL